MSTYICSVANGTRTSTQFTITTDLSDLSYTRSEIGCTITSNGSINSAAKSALGEKIKEDIDFPYIFESFKKDFPYEFFWHGNSWSYQYSFQGNTSKIWVTSLTISIRVSEDYRPSNTTSEYRASPSEIARGNAAAAKAQAIVSKYANKSDLEKLTAYLDEILSLSFYNSEAASGSYPYGDPWNLVYVFDGDPDTKVVCAGFSKAFKYLCDLSTFDKDIACYIATGDNHMWNVVRIDGSHYLADVTAGTSNLFLVGGISSEGGKVHRVAYKNYRYYDSRDDYLILSETDYHEHNCSTSWSSDGEQHWHTCSSCDERADVTSHTSSSTPATCTRQAICDICNTVYGEFAPHVYDQQSIRENYLQSAATCTTPATYCYSCVCGAKGTETFTAGSVDDINHQYLNGICSSCGYVPDSHSESNDHDSVSDSSSTNNSSDKNTNETPIMSSDSAPTSLAELIAELIIWFFRLLFGLLE